MLPWKKRKFALFKKSTLVMGQWGRRSGGSSSSLLVFCIQLWEGGVGRGHFQLNIHLYITSGVCVCVRTSFSQGFPTSLLKMS